MKRTFFYEFKKMMLVRKGIWFILLFFLCSMALLGLTDRPENEAAENYKAAYLFYLEKVEGPWSEQKEKYIEEEGVFLIQAKEELQKLYDAYYDGLLPEASFRQQLSGLEEELNREQGFQVLYDQYLYIQEAPENRWFVAANGWHGLLDNGVLDFLLVALLLLLVTPVFCEEYGSRMDTLILTAEGGRRNICNKLLLVLTAVTAVCAGYFLLRYGFFACKYGLPHGDYPLQSLSGFGGSSKNLSLLESFALLCGLQWFGCLFLSGLILVLSAVTKKYGLTVLLSTGLTVLPYIGLSERANYSLPGPLPYLLGSGFLKGSEYAADFLTGETVAVFREISSCTLALFWGISVLLLAAAVFTVLGLHQNRWNKAGKIRRSLSLLLCFFLAAGVSGCKSMPEQPGSVYNLSAADTCQQGGSRYYYDSDTRQLYFEEGDFGKAELLVRSPLHVLNPPDIWPSLFHTGTKVYYMKQSMDGYIDRIGRFASTVWTVSVMEVDTVDFQEKTVFEQNISDGRSYLGVDIPLGEQWEFLIKCSGFFLDKDNLFFVGEDVRQIDRRSGRQTLLPIPVKGNIAFDGRYIYYIAENLALMRYDPGQKQAVSLSGLTASDFCLTEQGIFFLNRRDQNRIYFCNSDGTDSVMSLDRQANSLTYSEGVIYFQDRKELQMYSLLPQEMTVKRIDS